MASNPLSLAGRVIIVSGAGGGGIGTHGARQIAEAGGTVIAVDRSQESLDRHIAPLIAEGLAMTPLVADVLAPEGIAAVIDAARAAKGDLYGLVTIVGGGPPATWGPAERLSRELWHSQLSYNLDSMFFITQAVAAELKAQKKPGSIVAIASINGVTASPYNVGYGAGKAAILSVVRTMGLELARDGIRLNAVAPGATATPTASLNTDPARMRRGIPMARFASPAEMAAPVLFLLSDMAGYMTGQCLTVDGGCNLKWSQLDDDNAPMFLRSESIREAMKR
jgi:NAD(P)-dependent dehydrogenase (short-subunit alcohol dehydrogenase family)